MTTFAVEFGVARTDRTDAVLRSPTHSLPLAANAFPVSSAPLAPKLRMAKAYLGVECAKP